MTKLVDNFVNLAKRTLNPESIKSLVIESSFEEQVAFHKIHERLLELSTNKRVILMSNRYPFVKVGGKWKFSAIAFAMYLDAAMPAMLKTKNEKMIAVHDICQSRRKYLEQAMEVFDKLQPTTAELWQAYQQEQTRLYENYMARQLSIFESVGVGG